MLQAFIITLREGVEAALIVGITLAYLTKIGRPELRKAVYAALVAASIGGIAVAIVLSRTQWNQDIFEGWIMLAAAFFGATFVLGLVAGAGSESVPDLIGPVGSGVLALLRLVVGITMIFQCFRIKDIIQDHATPPADPDQRFVEQVQLSGLMTFFFSIFYLQWAINKYVVGSAVGNSSMKNPDTAMAP